MSLDTLPVLIAAVVNMVLTWWDPQTRWFLAIVNTVAFILACFLLVGNTVLVGRIMLIYIRVLVPIFFFTWFYHVGIMVLDIDGPNSCGTDLLVATSSIALLIIQWFYLIRYYRSPTPGRLGVQPGT